MKPTVRLRLFLLGSALLAPPSLHAVTLYWDGNDTTANADGGAGTWDTSANNWDNAAVAGAATAWNNSNNDTAVFGSTLGTVTLGTGITTGGITFNTTGYNITTGANTLTFGAANNSISLNNIAAASITGLTGGSGNVTLAAINPATAGAITLNGISTGGWSGTTTVNAGTTLSVDGITSLNQSLLNTSGITFNGGSIAITNLKNDANGVADRINNSASFTSNGGTFTWGSSNVGGTYAETIGSVSLVRGQMNFVLNGNLSSGSQTLTMAGLGQAVNSYGNITFSVGATNLTSAGANRIRVNGVTTSTAADQIIGPWATVGSAAATQNDYAKYTSDATDGYIVPAAIAASGESTWGTLANAYTLTAAAKTATVLTGTRNITALKNTTATNTIASVDFAAGDTITVTGHGFNNGDVVTFGGTAPGGLSTGIAYYVINKATDTFQVAATSGGSVIDLTSAGASNVTGGITLPTGFNLATYGILNASAAALAIGGNGGVLTLPTAGAGQLYLSAGSAGIAVDAPINDNSGALTLVKNGTSTLFPRNIASTYSGGTVINAGTVSMTADGQLGATTGGVTFNGSSTLSGAVTYNSSRTFTLNDGALATITGAANIQGQLTGTGNLVHTDNTALTLSNANNTFTGTMIAGGGTTNTITATSLGDATGAGAINLGTTTTQGAFTWAGNAGSTKTFSNRQIVLTGTTGGGLITASGASAADNLVISKDLLVTGVGAKTLVLGGTNTGANTFTAKIADGPGSVISLTKTGGGNWAITSNLSNTGLITASSGGAVANANIGTAGFLFLSGTNNNSGGFSVSGNGTLVFQGSQSLPTGSNISLVHAGGTNNNSIVKLLDDLSGTVNLSNTINLDTSNATGAQQISVGNNNTANGGTSSATTTGSTIKVANLVVNSVASGANFTSSVLAGITGANGYRLQIDNVTLNNLTALAAGQATNMGFNPTTANITIGNITMATGNTGAANDGVPTLLLSGSSADNRVTGIISNASDFATGQPLKVQKNNSGTWTLSGTNTFSGGLTLTGASAGSQLNINNAAALGTGTFTISGGDNGKIDNTSGSAITLSTNNAQSWSNNFAFVGSNDLNLGTGAVTMGGSRSVTVTAGTLTVGGAISGSFPLAKAGIGTLVLGGANAYTGATTVSAGKLLINGSLDALSAVAVNGGTLGGTGTINGSVTVAAAGNIAPGTSVGTLSIGGGLTVSAMANGGSGKLNCELDTIAASDKIAVSGTLTIGSGVLGISDFNFSTLVGLQNGTYTLITSGGINSGDSLDGAALSGPVGTGTGTLQINGNNIELVVSGLGGGPGPLDHFAISAISSPQTVGTPITGITLTAQDASNQTVTSFTGTVTFGGTGGFTGTSGTFTAGVLNSVSVMPTVAGSNLTFTVSGSGKSGSTTITTIQSRYDAWSGGAAFDADTNGDGIKNGLAWLLGATNKDVSALGKLPVFTESGGGMVLTFTCLNAANRGTSTLNMQHSSDLGISDPWSAVVVPEASGGPVSGVNFTVTPGNPFNTVTATIQASEAASGKLFGRLQATP